MLQLQNKDWCKQCTTNKYTLRYQFDSYKHKHIYNVHTQLTQDPACAFYKNNEFNQRMIEYLVK